MAMRLCSSLTVFCLTASLAWSDDTKKDQEALQGTWAVTEAVFGGKTQEPEKIKGLKVVFAGDKMTLVSPGDKPKREFSFKLDATTKPKAFDSVALDGPFKDQENAGIYQLEGAKLLLCIPNKPTKERPAMLESPDGSQLAVLTLKREKL